MRICLPCFRASPLTRRSRPRHEHSASEYAPGPELRHRLAGPQRCGPGEVVEIAGLAGAGPGELHRLGANTMLGAGEPPRARPELRSPITRVMQRPTVSQSTRTRRQMAVLSRQRLARLSARDVASYDVYRECSRGANVRTTLALDDDLLVEAQRLS